MWGSDHCDTNGERLAQVIIEHNQAILGDIDRPTFFNLAAKKSSNIDLTLASPEPSLHCLTSTEEDLRGNDHFPICTSLKGKADSCSKFVDQLKLKVHDLIKFSTLLESTQEEFDNNWPLILFKHMIISSSISRTLQRPLKLHLTKQRIGKVLTKRDLMLSITPLPDGMKYARKR